MHTLNYWKKRKDQSGKMILKWIIEKELILLNKEDICQGKYTFGKREEECHRYDTSKQRHVVQMWNDGNR